MPCTLVIRFRKDFEQPHWYREDIMRFRSGRACIWLALSVLFPLITASQAQEQCTKDLLTPNIRVSFANSASRAFLRDVMCSLDYQEFIDKFGWESSAKYYDIAGG